ncbi:MAG: TIGR03087 family PEP-CTERM/XrtA system glycosyltransferase [Planctomycetota bacterium]|nr:TIGR03087 family PEP-CTERM/XrtA system glycosyltransferase [Planctomycetota bacterium]
MNILYLTHRVPYPPNRGDRIRSYHTLRHLAKRANVYLACLADEPVSAETELALGALCTAHKIVRLNATRWLRAASSLARGGSITQGMFASPPLSKAISEWSGKIQFDAVLAFCSSMEPYLNVPGLANVPVVTDLVDVDSQKWLDYAESAGILRRWLYRLEGARIRKAESRLVDRSKAVTLVSQAEAELFCKSIPNSKTHAVINGVDSDYFDGAATSGNSPLRLVFVGALDYRPNIDGIRWFCQKVWPRLREKCPLAELTIVGRAPTGAVSDLASRPGVQIAANVADVRPYLAQATLVIAPLQIARGIQNKVLEAMAMQRCVVGSSSALHGLDLESGVHAVQCDSPTEWIQTIADLALTPDRVADIGTQARRFVLARHDWSHCLRPLGALLGLNGEDAAMDVADQVAIAAAPLQGEVATVAKEDHSAIATSSGI